MQYLGGKKRIAKQLCEFLNKQINKQDKYYFEPFVGSCAIIENIEHPIRYGNDANKYLIELYKALQNGWIPPKNISEDEYQYVKNNKEENYPLTAFCGIGCSYSGKWFGGYARNSSGRNYAMNAHNVILKQLSKIQNVKFSCRDYRDCNPQNALVYCDPPYANTTKYDFFDGFNNDEFWEIMRKWSENNKVFISEYVAPEDFECVLEIETRTDLRNSDEKMIPRTERIFTLTQ